LLSFQLGNTAAKSFVFLLHHYDHRYVVVPVAENRPPGKPRRISTEASPTSITVSWEPPEGNVYVQDYIIGWGANSPQKETRVDGKRRAYDIMGLGKKICSVFNRSKEFCVSQRCGLICHKKEKAAVQIVAKDGTALLLFGASSAFDAASVKAPLFK